LTQDEAWGWRFAGVPKNAPALSIQLQQKGDANPDLYYRQRCRQLLKTLDLLTPESLLLYHGPSLPDWFVEKLPATLHVVKCRSFMTGRGNVMREKRYLHRR